MNETLDVFLSDLARLERAGEVAVLATLLAARGASSSTPGAKLWLTADGATRGSLTLGSCAEGLLRREAEVVARVGSPARLTLDLGPDEQYELGMSCAGQIEVWLERVDFGALDGVWRRAEGVRAVGKRAVLIAPLREGARRFLLEDVLEGEPVRAAGLALLELGAPPARLLEAGGEAYVLERWDPPEKLLVVGGGPVAEALVQLGKPLGFHVTVVASEAQALQGERFAGADVRRGGLVNGALKLPACDERTHVVVAVHNYGFEVPALEWALASQAPYVAMIASRRRGRAVLDFLAMTGLAPAQLARVRTPAGLDLGAASPAGIALSVLGEVVGRAHGKTVLAR